jgi:hypothetical protein
MTPGNVQVLPPSVVYPQPACRKSLATLSNWRQPIAMRVESVGSTAIEGSLAASPMMLLPRPSTLTWTLTKPSLLT